MGKCVSHVAVVSLSKRSPAIYMTFSALIAALVTWNFKTMWHIMTHETNLEFSNQWRFIAFAEVSQFYLLKLVD